MPFKSPNYTQTPNDLFDEFMCEMTEAELKVVLAVVRGTFGYHKSQCDLSLPNLAKATGMSQSSVLRGALAATKRKLIKRTSAGKKTSVWKIITSSTIEEDKHPLPQRKTSSTVEDGLPLPQRKTSSTIEEQVGLNKGERKKERGKKENAPPAAIAVLEHALEVTFSKHDTKSFLESLPDADEASAKKFVHYWRTVDPRGKKKDSYPPTAKQIIHLWKIAQRKTATQKSLPLHRAKR
jgi:phage replication O-like protein O